MYSRYADLRDKKGYRDSDVAKELNITPSTFSDWKNNKSTPNTEKLLKIAKLLDTTVEYLVTGEIPDTPANIPAIDYDPEYLNNATAIYNQIMSAPPEIQAAISTLLKSQRHDS